MKLTNISDVFGDEATNRLTENADTLSRMKKRGQSPAMKPVLAYGNPDNPDVKFIVHGVYEADDQIFVPVTENVSGTINRQDVPLSLFSEMIRNDIVRRIPDNDFSIRQTVPVGDPALSDFLDSKTLLRGFINGCLEERCIRNGYEFDGKPIGAIRSTELDDNTALIVGITYLQNRPHLSILTEDYDDDSLQIARTDVSAEDMAQHVKSGLIVLDDRFRPVTGLVFYEEASRQSGHLVTDPESVRAVEKSLTPQEKADLTRDRFDPEKDSVKALTELDEISYGPGI